jgi:hypothetical protein
VRHDFGLSRIAAWSISPMTDLDLVNWTMREARQLGTGHRMHGELENAAALDNLFEVLDDDLPRHDRPRHDRPRHDRPRHDQSKSEQSKNDRSTPSGHRSNGDDQGGATTISPTGADARPIVTAAELASPARELPAPMSARLKAIVEPDLYTAPSDRDRAIVLRWVLRDIKRNRLKFSPVDRRDLQELIELGLVEMANEAPVLTEAGAKALRR